jgi:hypothetical protein
MLRSGLASVTFQIGFAKPIDCLLPVAYHSKSWDNVSGHREESIVVVAFDLLLADAGLRRTTCASGFVRSGKKLDAFTTRRNLRISNTSKAFKNRLGPFDNLAIVSNASIQIDTAVRIILTEDKAFPFSGLDSVVTRPRRRVVALAVRNFATVDRRPRYPLQQFS